MDLGLGLVLVLEEWGEQEEQDVATEREEDVEERSL